MNIDILGNPPTQDQFDAEILASNKKIKRNQKLSAIISFIVLAFSMGYLSFNEVSKDVNVLISIFGSIACAGFVIYYRKFKFYKKNILINFSLVALLVFVLINSGISYEKVGIFERVLSSIIIAVFSMGLIEILEFFFIEGMEEGKIFEMSPTMEKNYIEIEKYIKEEEIAQYCEKVGLQDRPITNIEYFAICDFYKEKKEQCGNKEMREKINVAKSAIFKTN